jgi:hypothetical protein
LGGEGSGKIKAQYRAIASLGTEGKKWEATDALLELFGRAEMTDDPERDAKARIAARLLVDGLANLRQGPPIAAKGGDDGDEGRSE